MSRLRAAPAWQTNDERSAKREQHRSGITKVCHLVIHHSFELRNSDFVINDRMILDRVCAF
jgi:hypothetical protein